jgi:hypothetical protein
MSLYQLNRIMYLLEVDPAFLARIRSDPKQAIADFDLSEEERAAVLAGDVGTLYLMGVNMFMLDSVARHEILGVNREIYMSRVRAAAQTRKSAERP